jgi:hypothetical protein
MRRKLGTRQFGKANPPFTVAEVLNCPICQRDLPEDNLWREDQTDLLNGLENGDRLRLRGRGIFARADATKGMIDERNDKSSARS